MDEWNWIETAIIIECPICHAEQEDFDGFGVVHCENCGYCVHPCCKVVDGDSICEICGTKIARDRENA